MFRFPYVLGNRAWLVADFALSQDGKSFPNSMQMCPMTSSGFCASIDSTDRFKSVEFRYLKAMDEYGIKGRFVLCVFAPLVL